MVISFTCTGRGVKGDSVGEHLPHTLKSLGLNSRNLKQNTNNKIHKYQNKTDHYLLGIQGRAAAAIYSWKLTLSAGEQVPKSLHNLIADKMWC